MANGHAYEQLDSNDPGIPSHPPNYEDLEAHSQGHHQSPSHTNGQHNSDDDDDSDDRFDINHNPNNVHFEQFEIGDDDDDDHRPQDGLLQRASILTKKLATRFNHNIIHPINSMVDPIYETYSHFHMLYEQSILKIGNPLVVKRLFYVFFITILIFLITRYDTNDGVNGASGGTFSSGKFYDLEKLSASIREYIDPKLMKENLEYFSVMPHITGSKGDLTLARFIDKYMDNNGIRTIEFNQLQSYLNYPNSNVKETYLKLADDSFSANLFEQGKSEMEYVSFNPNALNTNSPLENYYVYANYGSPEDFQQLKDNNIELNGRIILVKYGGNTVPEPNKLQLAQSYGARALVFVTPEYSVGSKKVDEAIQKDNVGLTRVSPGDILTPGWSSEEGFVVRLPWFKSSTTPKLPSIPISSKDGKHLISTLKGGVKFSDGSHSGTGKSDVKMKMMVSNEQRRSHQLWNVIGSIKGREQAEKGIVIGAARDSGCYGTIGTNTGTIILLEMIKIFTSLQRQYQWSPSRSIYFVSFDATEYNLAGSAEWIENRRDSLRREGYAYVDLSDAISGDDLSIKSHPFLHDVIKKCLKKVKGEDGSSTLYDLYKKSNKNSDQITNNMLESKNYLPFINLVNMPSMEIKFEGKNYPKNSCFDDFKNFEDADIDSSMKKHSQLVELLSIVTLHLADDPIIPYNFIDFTNNLIGFANDLERHASDIRNTDSNLPVLDFGPLRKAIESLKFPSEEFYRWTEDWKKLVEESLDIEPSIFAMNRWKWHDNILRFNELFISQDNQMQLQRPGFVNMLIGSPFAAPANPDSGYEWNSFPMVRDNLINRDFAKAQDEIMKVSEVIVRAASRFLER